MGASSGIWSYSIVPTLRHIDADSILETVIARSQSPRIRTNTVPAGRMRDFFSRWLHCSRRSAVSAWVVLSALAGWQV